MEDCSSSLHQLDYVEVACSRLEAFCAQRSIPVSHGFGHAQRVLQHVDRAIAVAEPPLLDSRALSVRLAALLHDADDSKYFPDGPKNQYPNAKRIMQEAGVSEDVSAEALKMIGFVSCSKNGNSVPLEAEHEPEWLWPRWADRLEATGEIGVVRCWQFNRELQDVPLFTEKTPKPQSEIEVWELGTPERFERYQKSGGKSESMLDHYFDKLLQVARPPAKIIQNCYLEDKMASGAAPLVKILLAYGKTGEVPMEELYAMEARTVARGGT